MCTIGFARSSTTKICIQSINCSLMVYEAEHQLFSRNLPTLIYPGPIKYASQSDSIIITSGGILCDKIRLDRSTERI